MSGVQGPGARKMAVSKQDASPHGAHILATCGTHRSKTKKGTDAHVPPPRARAGPQPAKGSATSTKTLLPILASKGNGPILAAGLETHTAFVKIRMLGTKNNNYENRIN